MEPSWANYVLGVWWMRPLAPYGGIYHFLMEYEGREKLSPCYIIYKGIQRISDEREFRERREEVKEREVMDILVAI